MIRKLNEQDLDEVLAFLYEEPEINLYIIGDIKNFGFNDPHRQIFGEFKQGKIYAVASQNLSHITYYAASPEFNLDWPNVFASLDYLFISGKDTLLEVINEHMPAMRPDRLEFMKSTTFEYDETLQDSRLKVLSSKDDAKKVYTLLNQIEELDSVRKKTEEEFIQYLLDNSDGNGTTVFIEEDNQVIASASAVGETKRTAMIVGVATHPDYRNQGLGHIVLHYLLNLYINKKGKTLCLYYDDEAAGYLYEKLGFVKINDWIMLIKDE